MIIGVAGFSWSGSGAVIDYLMEYTENQVYTPEFIIAYHPDGLHDLDINLNENCAKFLSSGVAIPRFRKIANTLLVGKTNGKSARLTQQYLDKLIQARWVGLETGQELVRNQWAYRHIGMRIRYNIIAKLPPEICWKYKPYPLAEMEFSICPDQFEDITKDYMDSLLEAIGLDIKKNIVLNQPFPGNNPVPFMKYFRDSKAIVVDRDPRDVYVFLKYVFPGHSYSVPLENVDTFCSYYDNMHKNLNKTLDYQDVLYVRFEDLIYHYEESTASIKSFLNLREHSFPKRYFVPEESEANTQIYKTYGKADEIRIIEEKLRKYLYDYSSVAKKSLNSVTFDGNPKSSGYSFVNK